MPPTKKAKVSPAKKPKFKIVKVAVRPEASVSKYLRESPNADDLKELLRGVKDMKNWSCKTNKDNKVIEAHAEVPAHPSHVHNRDWKYQIERGNASVDRLILAGRKYSAELNKRDPNTINVSVSCNAFVETDTH